MISRGALPRLPEQPLEWASLDDGEMARVLSHKATLINLHSGVPADFRNGLEELRQRVGKGGIDEHPILAPIVQHLAELSPREAMDISAQCAAVINATTENPWRSLTAPSRKPPAPEMT
jgi:hypothetical protein